MFKHRFNPENAHDFRTVIDAVDIMTGRAKSTLNMFVSYVEGDCDDLHKFDVSGVIYGVLAELEDVGAVLKAHFKANNNLQKQVDALSHIILSEKILTPDKLKLILDVAVLPIAAQAEAVAQMRQVIEPENNTIH
jgi:hypothetical protein